MAVMPSCRQIRWISSRTRLAVAGSRLATGSSARMVFGAWISARDSDALLLAAGQLVGAAERPVQQFNPIENLERQAALGSTWRQQRPQRRVEPKPAEQDVLQRRMPADQMVLLEDHGRLPAVTAQRCSAREDRLVIAANDGATRRPGEPVQASQQRGFAGPGGTEQHDKSAEFKAEADPVQCANAVRIDERTSFDPETILLRNWHFGLPKAYRPELKFL
jgi:hypothetical protein